MAKLYEITNELLKLENYDEFSEEHQQILDDVKDDMSSKIESIAKMIKNLEADKSILKAESKRLADRAKATDNKINWLKNYVKDNMTVAGIDKIKGELLTVSLQNVKASVEITDDDLVPVKFKKEIVETRISKENILNAYKAGETVTGVVIYDNNKSVRIR